MVEYLKVCNQNFNTPIIKYTFDFQSIRVSKTIVYIAMKTDL